MICVAKTFHSHYCVAAFSGPDPLPPSTVAPQGASGRVQKAEVEARRGGRAAHADRGGRGRPRFADSRGAAGRGAPGRGEGPPTAQDAPGDSHADTGGTQQTAGVAAAPAQGASATGSALHCLNTS